MWGVVMRCCGGLGVPLGCREVRLGVWEVFGVLGEVA